MHDHYEQDREQRWPLNQAEQDYDDGMALGESQECEREMMAEDIAELERLEAEIVRECGKVAG